MTTQTLPLFTTRIRQDEGDDESTLARQWRLLKLLAFAPKGFTIKELMAVLGMSEKTVRRDLAFLKEVGFDVSESVEEFGRKFFRISRLSESTGRKGTAAEKYAVIHDALQQIRDVALILGDSPLAESLNRLQEWVQGKCRGPKRKPR
jgi:predicted DNA-binding transcriptional regulator YafY